MKFDRMSAFGGALASALLFGLVGGLWPATASLRAQSISVDAALSELRRDLHTLGAAATRAQVLAVAYQIDTSGLHALDVSVNEQGEIPAQALGRVRRARIAAQSVAWPETLKETAHELVGHFVDLEAALRDEDVDAAKDPAEAAHSVGHQLSSVAYEWLSQGEMADEDHMARGAGLRR